MDGSTWGSLVQGINQQLDESDEDLVSRWSGCFVVSGGRLDVPFVGELCSRTKATWRDMKARKHPHVVLTAPSKLIFFVFVQTKDA